VFGTHEGVVGIKAQGHWEGHEYRIGKVELCLETLLSKAKQQVLGKGKGGRARILSANVGGSREALSWAWIRKLKSF
jgi:hypothetical protein